MKEKQGEAKSTDQRESAVLSDVDADVSLRRWMKGRFWLLIWHLTPALWICNGCAYSPNYNKFWHKWGRFVTTQFGTYYE